MQQGIEFIYLLAVLGLIFGLKAMSSPVTARKGIVWAGCAMALAVIVTFFLPNLHNFGWMIAAIIIGGAIAWKMGRDVKMTDMPQMVAIYNGMGGGAAALIAGLEFCKEDFLPLPVKILGLLGAVIGCVAFAGSCVAFAKLQGIMKKSFQLPAQNVVMLLLCIILIAIGIYVCSTYKILGNWIVAFFIISLLLGIFVTTPIGGADMPVVISLLNAFTGLAVGLEGYVLHNPALIIAGMVVGASGSLLTMMMAKAMNRKLSNIIFAPISGDTVQNTAEGVVGEMKEYSSTDTAALMRYAQKIVIIPGYGMAVAGAQHKVWELVQLLESAGVDVSFAIHPVAGRMPGHMNVLLAEAGVPYDKIFDLEEINEEFSQVDVALVIGANDVVNPAARTDKSSPIYGMPILNADHAHNVIVVKRGRGSGYSGIENSLFYAENTRMLFGSAQQAISDVVTQLKVLL